MTMELLIIEMLVGAIVVVTGVFIWQLRTTTRMVEDTYRLVHALNAHLSELRQFPVAPAFMFSIAERLRKLADGLRRWNR